MQNVREVRTAEQAAQEDLFFGQSVILWARWSVILAGTVLVLLTSRTIGELTWTFPFFLAMMAMNFFLHGRYVMGSPLNRAVVVAASVIDLVLITGIISLWPNGHVGIRSQFYVLYFPVVFAFALVFPRAIEAAYTIAAMVAYAAACFVFTPAFVSHAADLKALTMRMVVLAAMGFLGNYYFRIQRERLRRATAGQGSALKELQERLRPAPLTGSR